MWTDTSVDRWIDRWTDDSYLPEAGDWSIGIDATTSLDYFGNLLNSGASAPTPGYVNQFDQTFYGKLMTDGGAWRVRVGLNMHKNVISTEVTDEAMMANSGVQGTVTDKQSIGETDIDLWLGKEWRRGPTRLQGVWGAEAGIMMESETTTWEFGNPPGDQFGTQVDEDEQSGHRSGPVSVRSAWLGRDENSEEERKMAKEKYAGVELAPP